jgi:DNA-damage-inducible protein J
MSTSNINIRVNSEIKAQAQRVFASLGLDMTTAVDIFLRQTIRQHGIPFAIMAAPDQGEAKMPRLGGWEGKIKMSDDFDAPLDDFKANE